MVFSFFGPRSLISCRFCGLVRSRLRDFGFVGVGTFLQPFALYIRSVYFVMLFFWCFFNTFCLLIKKVYLISYAIVCNLVYP